MRDLLAKAVLAAAVLAGVSFIASWGRGLPEAVDVAWKGAGVGLLALHAALQARRVDGWLIAAVLALGALGDVLLEVTGLTVGAVAFLAGHVVAIVLYLRNRRPALSLGGRLVAVALAPAIMAIAYGLPADRQQATGIAIYATGLGLMVATAWVSRFPRALTGLGALMFAASDLFLFARLGPLAGERWVDFAVWGLYFGGQLLICLGVTRAAYSRTDDVDQRAQGAVDGGRAGADVSA